jgi:4-hydroxybenzoate polyprenyltransferase
MRGAGCTVNDMWDRKFDAAVARTRDRPLASGELTMTRAMIWLAAQCSIGLLVLLQVLEAATISPFC